MDFKDYNFILEVEKVDEAGYRAALRGLALNKKQNKDMTHIAKILSDKDGGHNKFLESIYIWLEVTGPRYWWQEADTFRLSTKQSESTMHTLLQELAEVVDPEAFENDSLTPAQTRMLEEALAQPDPIEQLIMVKRLLPEGFLQKRMWCMSYKTLRNIILQRRTHKLPHWKSFIEQVLNQVDHPELLPPSIKGGL